MTATRELRDRLFLTAKRWFFAGRGEPYRIGGKTLRFVPGTRPVRLRYQRAENAVNRYDAQQLAWMLNNLADGDLAIDVGANYGQYTIVMAERCGGRGSVIAFEPNPHARNVLKRNFDLNPSVKRATIVPFACSDVAGGEVELYHNGNACNSALVPFAAIQANDDGRESFRVPVTTLDSYLVQRGLPEPRCIKIDTEGAEIRVLQGARNLLSSRSAILCELHPYAWPQFGNSLQELKELVAQYGRRMRYLDQESEIADNADYGIVTLERVQ
jgi:FkbM family methyltransferase